MPLISGTGREFDAHVAALVTHQIRAVMHEIRQPVAAVFALAETVRSLPGLGDDARAYLDAIIEQTRELTAAAASVLDAEADPAAGEPDGHAVDLEEVVDSVVASFRVTWPGTLERRGDRGGLSVHGSRTRLRRGLVNVVDNAVHAAGPRGRVTVDVHRGADDVQVVVEDDGPGFGRVPVQNGLGLRLTEHMLVAIGGSLSIDRRRGPGGTRVALCLPVATHPGRGQTARAG